MFYFIHALFGSWLGENISSIIIIAILGILSHFIIDMAPHWDGFFDKDHFKKSGKLKFKKKPVFSIALHLFDVILTIVLLVYITKKISGPHVLFGAGAALFPDLLKIGCFFGFSKSKKFMNYLKFHAKIQKDAGWKLGLFVQLIFVLIILKLLF